jgi:hypothetical protein
VACAFHRAAAQGDYAERLHDLLGAVLGAPVAAIPTAADRAAAWGATSGLDTIDGVLLGLDAVAARRAGTSRARRSRGAA